MVCETYIDLAQDLHVRLPGDAQTERERSKAALNKLQTAALGALATTTFTGMVVHRYGAMSYLHAGDSHLLLSRGDRLVHCTSEHVKSSGHELLNYLGTQPEWSTMGLVRPVLELTELANTFSETKLEAEWGTLPLQHGDRLALVTDGITGSGAFDRLDDEMLLALMDRRRIVGAQACANLLLRASRKVDDSTAIVVDISGHRTRWLE
jgi:serine/threonine protein phosphatase PrpC